jgi:hypothetical protein
MITVQEVVYLLLPQGYRELGGSDVFRILRHYKTGQCIKVYYNNYDTKDYVIIRESVENYNDKTNCI